MGQADPRVLQVLALRDGPGRHGNWVVQDKTGACGGIFVDRVTALRFAMFENGNRPQAVVMVPGVFELNMDRGAANGPQPRLTDSHPKRRAA